MKILRLSFLLVSCFISTAYAETNADLYQAIVPVPSNSQADWQQALPGALQQVLVKISGNPQIATLAPVKKQLANPAMLVQRYNYSMPDAKGQITLQVQFSAKAVNQLLHQSGQAITSMSHDLPLTLVWLAAPGVQGQALVTDSSNPAAQALQSFMQKQHVPVLWPAMDLQDINALPLNQLTDLNVSTIQGASQRYQVKTILAGTITQMTPGQWQGHWLFINNGKSSTWQTQGTNLNQVVSALGNNLIAALPSTTQKIPANGAQKAQIILQISGVNGLDDYADVVKYVRGLAGVSSVTTSQVNANSIMLNVTITSDQATLQQQIKTDGKLITDATVAASTGALSYEWTGTHVAANPIAPSVTPATSAVNNATTDVVSTGQNNTFPDSVPVEVRP